MLIWRCQCPYGCGSLVRKTHVYIQLHSGKITLKLVWYLRQYIQVSKADPSHNQQIHLRKICKCAWTDGTIYCKDGNIPRIGTASRMLESSGCIDFYACLLHQPSSSRHNDVGFAVGNESVVCRLQLTTLRWSSRRDHTVPYDKTRCFGILWLWIHKFQ